MATLTLRFGSAQSLLSDDEVTALFWAYNYAIHHQHEYGVTGSAISRLLVAGGSFDAPECEQLLQFCALARDKVSTVELEVFKRKYGSNTLAFSANAAIDLVHRYKLAYRNLNVEPAAIFVGRKRRPDLTAPQRIGDVPPFASAVATLDQAARAGAFTATHSAPSEFF